MTWGLSDTKTGKLLKDAESKIIEFSHYPAPISGSSFTAIKIPSEEEQEAKYNLNLDEESLKNINDGL